ncbi:MAG: hypothetical protein K0S65_1852 [Labilithrix sp.]|nr:hypothetical protein [Labilithrix sp.]
MRFARENVSASAASLFLVDSDTLRGLVSEWDWTRTSFASRLRDWPTVERVLSDGKLHTISKKDALGAEVLWFEPRGIVSTVCVPLCAGERRIGVLFFDFDGETTLLQKERSFLTDVGERTTRALARRPAYASVVQELPLLQ